MENLPSPDAPLLSVRNLRVTYSHPQHPEGVAVNAASFSVGEGEVLGVLGESGSGKSSIAMAVMRMLPESSKQTGEIAFKGCDLASLTDSEMRQIRGAEISMIFQDAALSLSPLMRVGDQVGEVLRAHGKADSTQRSVLVRRLFADLELGDVDRIYQAYPHQLSGGQCQRISIAQALICSPALIIADEPTASLDAVTTLEIVRLMRRINQQNSTAFILISHDPAVVAPVAHKVAVMHAGEIVEYGTADRVLNQPHHQYTQALLAARQPLPQPA